MSRGTLLSDLRALLKAELRDAQETNSAADTEYNYALANKQKDLALGYDWPFLVHTWDASAGVGSRFITFPTTDTGGLTVTPNFERPMLVEVLHASYWKPIYYGIGSAEYNAYNSDNGVESSPIQKWQFSSNVNETSGANQFEVWPMPSVAQTIRFTGQRVVKALTSDSHTADLDDLLLVYFVAADYLALRGQQNASLMLRKAQERLVKLRASYPVEDCPVVFGKQKSFSRENTKIIAVA